MPLELSLRAPTALPIEVEGITPDLLREKSLAEIEQTPIFCGNERVPLAELFHVAGSTVDDHIEFVGDAAGVHHIGARMKAGTIHVVGSAGRHAGSHMAGGTLTIDQAAGDWLGAEMRDGLIRVGGDAGDHVGSAYPAGERGMRGGTILIIGCAGANVGHTMRRGLIAVAGNVGDFAALNMIAGSVVVFGSCGARPAAGMRRGTLAALGSRPELLPTFRTAGRCEPLFLQVYLRALRELDFPVPAACDAAAYELFSGDLLNGGRGEVIVRV